ncbi:MAG: cytochrome b5 [Syntrophobacteraceae bacterium]|nr:cytochrome b5 [Syntrophobacteraceae bacterium]
MREFDLEEVSGFNGQDGKPVYIVHQGKVYDVTLSKMWKGGVHMRRHHAGHDLTTDFQAAPHGPEVFERYPQVGVIRSAAAPERKMPEVLSVLLSRYPMLKRHPHPMTVHFPIVFMLSATFFNLLYLLTGVRSFELTGLHCMVAGMVMLPVVMTTGLFTWWYNYMAKPIRPVSVKIVLSIALFVVTVIAVTWRLAQPDILEVFRVQSAVYFILIMSFTPLVIVVGWFGAQMTFPIERE